MAATNPEVMLACGMLHAVPIAVSFHAGLHVQAVFLLIESRTNGLARAVLGTPAGAIHYVAVGGQV